MRHVLWKGKVTHPPSVGEKLVSVPQESSSRTTHLLLGFNEIKELYH